MADNNEGDGDEEIKKITFRIEESKKEEFERAVNLAQGFSILDSNTSKSELLRQSIDEMTEDLYARIEEQTGIDEGNLGDVRTSTTPTSTPTTTSTAD